MHLRGRDGLKVEQAPSTPLRRGRSGTEASEHLRRLARARRLLNWDTIGLPVCVLVLCWAFWYDSPNFLTGTNFANVGRQIAVLLLVSCGMTLVILTAGI